MVFKHMLKQGLTFLIFFTLTASSLSASEPVSLNQLGVFLTQNSQLPGGCSAKVVIPHQGLYQLQIEIKNGPQKTLITQFNADGDIIRENDSKAYTWYFLRPYSEKTLLPPFYKNLRDHFEIKFTDEGQMIQVKSIIWKQKWDWLTNKYFWIPQSQILCG